MHVHSTFCAEVVLPIYVCVCVCVCGCRCFYLYECVFVLVGRFMCVCVCSCVRMWANECVYVFAGYSNLQKYTMRRAFSAHTENTVCAFMKNSLDFLASRFHPSKTSFKNL